MSLRCERHRRVRGRPSLSDATDRLRRRLRHISVPTYPRFHRESLNQARDIVTSGLDVATCAMGGVVNGLVGRVVPQARPRDLTTMSLRPFETMYKWEWRKLHAQHAMSHKNWSYKSKT